MNASLDHPFPGDEYAGNVTANAQNRHAPTILDYPGYPNQTGWGENHS
jgi:hypothetical protein